MTKTAITSAVNTDFPSGCTQCITAALLRTVFIDIINSYLDLNGAGSFSCPTNNWVSSQTTSASTCTAPNPAVLAGNVAVATGTTSNAGRMMGTGTTCKITPAYTGRLEIIYSGNVQAATAQQISANGYYGTGTPPNNAATVTGTLFSANAANVPIANGYVFVVDQTILSGLVTGTQYWFDLALYSDGTHIATPLNLYCTAHEF